MSDRVQILLLLSLTLIGITSLGGMVFLEARSLPIMGGLPAIAGGVVVALTGLVTRWGDTIKPLSDKVDRLQSDLSSNTVMTADTQKSVNGQHAALVQEIADLKLQIANRGAVPLPDALPPTPHNHV